MSSTVKGILFFGVCPALMLAGGLLASDFFVLDTPQNPNGKLEYPIGWTMVILGFLGFVGFLIWGKSKERANR